MKAADINALPVLPDVLRCVICRKAAAYKAVGGAACSPEHVDIAYRRATAKVRPLCCQRGHK